MKRTHLPLNGLRVLDAAARHLSFTRAADELAVTPAAVGQQIRALEDALGVVLFRRTPKGLELTHECEAGLEALRNGFLQFEEAVRAMQAGQTSQCLAIAAPRVEPFAGEVARLAAYSAANPDVKFLIVPHDGEVDFTQANLDLAIIYADGPSEHEGVALAEGALVTVGQGAMIAWAGGPMVDAPLMHLGDAGLALDAAAQGIGQAQVPALLAAADVAAGRVSVTETLPSAQTYWLVAPLPQWRQKKVKALVAALIG